jgi:hypothetical protein
MPIAKDKTRVPVEEAPLTNMILIKPEEVEMVYQDPKVAFAFFANLLISIVLGIICTSTCDWSNIRFKNDHRNKTTVYEVIGITGVCLMCAVSLSYVSLWAAGKYTRCLLYSGGVLMIIMTIVFFLLSGS